MIKLSPYSQTNSSAVSLYIILFCMLYFAIEICMILYFLCVLLLNLTLASFDDDSALFLQLFLFSGLSSFYLMLDFSHLTCAVCTQPPAFNTKLPHKTKVTSVQASLYTANHLLATKLDWAKVRKCCGRHGFAFKREIGLKF